MKALQIIGPQRYAIIDLPIPEPADDEVVLRMRACTVCNQHDLKVFDGPHERYPLEPGFPGHEGAGEIVALGRRVPELQIGDRVVTTGIGGSPLYREYVTRQATTVVKYQADVPFVAASPLELFGCINRAVMKTPVKGRRVAVVGLGPAGMVCCQMLAAYEAQEIVAVDVDTQRCKQALEMGATDVVDATQFAQITDDVRRYMSNRDRPAEADPFTAVKICPLAPVVFECSGSARSLEASLLLAGEEVVIFGVTQEQITAWPAAWFSRELTIKASRMLELDDLRAAVALLDAGRIDPGRLISAVIPFECYGDALALVRAHRATKVALAWDSPASD